LRSRSSRSDFKSSGSLDGFAWIPLAQENRRGLPRKRDIARENRFMSLVKAGACVGSEESLFRPCGFKTKRPRSHDLQIPNMRRLITHGTNGVMDSQLPSTRKTGTIPVGPRDCKAAKVAHTRLLALDEQALACCNYYIHSVRFAVRLILRI
jgi:hypothetical protein